MTALIHRLKKALFPFTILAMAFIVYYPFRGAEFLLWDDDTHITANPLFHPLTWSHFFEIWTSSHESLYMPVTYSVWAALVAMIQCACGETWAQQGIVWPFLMLNFIVHAANGLMVYILARKIAVRPFYAAVAALLFIFHPIQAEAVAPVSGFKELIWVSFALGSILALLSNRLMLALALSLLSMLSKPTAAILPLIFAGIFISGDSKKTTREKLSLLLPAFFAAAAISIVTKILQADQFLLHPVPLASRVWVIADSVGFYAKKMFWPLPLAPDYGRTPDWLLSHLPTNEMILASVLLLAFIITAWKFPISIKKMPLPLLVLIAPLLPVSGLISFLQQNYSTVTDRYLYFSMAGLAIGAAQIQTATTRLSKYFPALALAVVALLAAMAFEQTRLWNSNQSIFTHILAVNPDSFMAENNLGILAASRGDGQKALTHFQRSLQLNPRNAPAAKNYGILLYETGQAGEALAHFQNEVSRDPSQADLRVGYGYVLDQLKRPADALKEFEAAVKIDPRRDDANLFIGITLCQLSRCREAIPYFQELVHSAPQNQQYLEYLRKARAE